MILFLDESGDIGFSFTKPYRDGGSSRFLTLSFLLIPRSKKHLPIRIVKEIYKKKDRPYFNELKGSNLSREEKILVAEKTEGLLTKNDDINIFCITVRKTNVEPHIRNDPNKIYNYMTCLALEGKLININELIFVPDPRSIKVASGNSLVDYLQTKVYFEWGLQTKITRKISDSKIDFNLQFVDFITNIIWSKYENFWTIGYDMLVPHIDKKELYF